MDYEKKYKEALEIAKRCYKDLNNLDGVVATMSKDFFEEVFPELNESEDERLRKEIIEFIKISKPKWKNYRDYSSWIAWLEKQKYQKPTENFVETWKDMRLEVYQQASGNRHEPNYSDDTTKMFSLNDIDEIIEKMSEQKNADKIEPKFKIDDWITNSIETVQITGYDIDYGYQVDYKGNLQHRDTDIIEKEYHLWTIQDAKDGDVLVDKYAIIIFRKIGNCVLDDVVDFYICYSFEKGIIIQRHNLHCGSIDSVFFKPATKEQRCMFFQKMHEEGYEWDFEVKELNKIDKKTYDSCKETCHRSS